MEILEAKDLRLCFSAPHPEIDGRCKLVCYVNLKHTKAYFITILEILNKPRGREARAQREATQEQLDINTNQNGSLPEQ